MIPLAENAKGYLTFLLGPFRKLCYFVVDINCEVTSIYIRTVAIIMKQVTLGNRSPYTLRFPRAANEPPRASHPGVSSRPLLPQESSCIRAAGKHLPANNTIL